MEKQTFYLLGDSVFNACSTHIKNKISPKFDLKLKEYYVTNDGIEHKKALSIGDSNLLLSYLLSLYAQKHWADYLVMGACLDDVRTYKDEKKQVSTEEYMDNLQEIAEISGMIAANRFWILGTPVSEELQEDSHYKCLNRDIEHYNNLATGLLPLYDIECIDLYSFTKNLNSPSYTSAHTFDDDISQKQADYLVENIFF